MTATLENLPIDLLHPHPKNVRRTVEVSTELADSILALGILEPLLVAPTEPDPYAATEYVVIAGHRRLAAAKAAGLTEVPCLIRRDLTETPQILEAMLVENLQRTDLTALEEGAAYQELLSFPGYTQTRIAQATGRSKKTVSSRLKITKLPATVTDQYLAGQVTLGQLEQLTELSGHPDLLEIATKALGKPWFGGEMHSLRRTLEVRATTAKRVKELRDTGQEVTDQPDDLSSCEPEPWQVEWIAEAIADAADITGTGVPADVLLTDEQHAQTCPDHRWWISSRHGVLAWCLNPDQHLPEGSNDDQDDDTEAGSSGSTAIAREKAERSAARDRMEQLSAAARGRYDWFVEHYLASPAHIIEPIRLLIAQAITYDAHTDEALSTAHEFLTGRPLPTDLLTKVGAPLTAEDRAVIDAALTADYTASAGIAALWHLTTVPELGPRYSSAWNQGRDERLVYDHLLRLGYQPSDAERAAVDQADQATESEPAA